MKMNATENIVYNLISIYQIIGNTPMLITSQQSDESTTTILLLIWNILNITVIIKMSQKLLILSTLVIVKYFYILNIRERRADIIAVI